MLYQIFTSSESIQTKVAILLAIALAGYLAIVLHEIAHGLVASWQGDNTARQEGRLSLNPLKHLDPTGFLLMLLVGIGWAKPVPVNPYNYKKMRKGIFLVSIAGVITNFILATLLFIIFVLCSSLFVEKNLFTTFLYYFLSYGVSINIALIAFNLLPIYPLDGFRIVESFTRYGNKFCIFMRKYGPYIFLGLLVLGYIANFVKVPQIDILGTYMNFVQNLIHKLYGLVLGWF